ncbi:signal recognition particle-docking protein FtsY [Fretibacter rubidus]|uniref:signal recognition particle-docking protein FtsY n=1 Tax=Fretibacter rubidus TaxID=570162 RepID=UPI00352B8AB9
MADDNKKKRGFLSKLGFKSKEEKLAEEAAERAAQQQLVDEAMAARMAAINAAALKSAREQDAAKSGVDIAAEDEARIAAEEKLRAEEQARKDVEAAKRLAAEKRAKEIEAKRLAEEEAAFAAEEKARLEAEAKAEAERKARAAEAEKVRLAQAAKRKAEEEAALAKAAKEQGEREAQALREKQEAEAKARAEEDARIAAEQAEREAREKAEAEAARLAERDAARKKAAEAAAVEAAKLEAEREAKLTEDRRIADELAAQKAAEQAAIEATAANSEGGFLDRMSTGLKKSTSRMSDSVSAIFTKRKLDDAAIEELEDLLISSDLGVGVATKVTTLLAKDKFDKEVTDMEVKIALADVISDILTPLEKPIVLTETKPQIMLFVGVNGSGKTTTLGKIAKRYRDQGKKVMIAAGDTFRAAAVEQLTVWAERSDAEIISGKLGADAAGLVYDAIEQAKAKDVDVLMIDTAGRLQNRTELMDELSKVVRVIKKQDPSAPHHCILVLDATVGQNALSQTEVFRDTAGVTGLIMTKLDGTAKGGVLVALSDKYKLPIHAIGIGERIEDLENFSAPVFAAALSGVADALTPPAQN